MDINKAKSLSFDELRKEYKDYLQNAGLGKNTVQTAYSDTFYLWRKGSPDVFWAVVEAATFEESARDALTDALEENSSGNAASLVNSYLSQL